MLDAIGERHDADVVIVLRGRVRELERRLHRKVEPRHAADIGRHEPAGIQHEQHLLPPLRLVLPRDHFGAAGGGFPIDVSQVVARHPLAQRLEQPSLTEPAHRLHPGFATPQRLRYGGTQPHRHERRIHDHFPRQRHLHAVAAESQRSRAVDDEATGAAAFPAAAQWDDGHRLASDAARGNT